MKKELKRICSLVLALVMAFSLCACGNSTADSKAAADGGTPSADTFKIGVSVILSGAGAVYGEEAVNGVKLALDYINANGGFNGVQGDYVVYDEQSKAEEAVKIAQKFIQTDKVNAVLASTSSSLALAACPYYEKAGVVTLPMGNSPAFTQQGWKYVYHAVMNNDFTTPIVEDLLVQLGFNTVAVAKSQDDNGLNSAQLFIDACGEDGIQVLTEEAFATTDTDFSGQCARIVSANPECVFMSVSGDANGTFIKQLRSFGYTGLVFSKESMTTSMIDIAGEDAAKYVVFANPYVVYQTIEDCDIESVHAFLESYIAKFGAINTTDICYRAYDCVMTIWEAAKIAGSNDSEAIAQAMDAVKFEGLGGTLDFTVGDHEGYHTFNSFIEINRKNLDFQSWCENGGYDEYKAATGNEK